MTSQPYFVPPPRFAVWMVNLFTSAEEAESIQGDLHEEFSCLVSRSGAAVARKWYWRQTVKTSAHLACMGFRLAPWSTTAALVGGFLLLRFVSGLPDKLLAVVTDRYLSYWSTHFKAYMFWATDGMLIAHVIGSASVGCTVALAAKGREMVATIMLGLVLGGLGITASVMWLAKTGDVWMLASLGADSLAIVIGGAIVRTHRSGDTILPSDA